MKQIWIEKGVAAQGRRSLLGAAGGRDHAFASNIERKYVPATIFVLLGFSAYLGTNFFGTFPGPSGILGFLLFSALGLFLRDPLK